MDYKEIAGLSAGEVTEKFETTEKGLTTKEAGKRLEKFGENKIASKEVKSWEIFIRQFKSPFNYLLFGASIMSVLFGEGIDGLMITLFVVINSLLSFYQEYRSEQTVKLLKKYLTSKIRVIRNGKEENIEVNLLVPGDVVRFEPGDIIPADVRFVEDYNLIIDETVLTGESIQVSKTSEIPGKKVTDIYSASNIGFSGTTVTSGNGKAVVIATGPQSVYAGIVKLAGETKRVSSFETELSKFSKFTLWVVLVTLVFIVLTSIAIKAEPNFKDLIIFSIALAVSVVPETLPAVMTFCLSLGARMLTQKGVVVKRLTSVEDLGALQVLATDKTGTLTENKLEVANTLGKDKDKLLLFSTLASYFVDSTRNAQNNAFDLALSKVLSSDGKKKLPDFKKISEIPFDPGRKRVTTLLQKGQDYFLITRGSPEEVIGLSKMQGEKEKEKLLAWVASEGKEGRRCLAVALKELKNIRIKGKGENFKISEYESDMGFLGLISFDDPIKESSYKAVEKAKELGVMVKIITGDSPEVAGQVAKEIDLTKGMEEVITGSEFQKLTSMEKHDAVSRYSVFARIVPEQKHEIITLLKEKYYVGFLGEGINDAPALKAANVAVVVDGASDVAKEAADIVLLKKDLEVIIDGVREGRKVFANTSKYITATMASNFGNFFAIALITPFINFLPMLPLQILLIDLLSDFPMIMVATDNVDPEVLKVPKRYNLKSFAFSALSFGIISTAFDFIIFNYFVRMGEASLHTYWFIESILSELLIIYTVRSRKSIFKATPPSGIITYLTFATIALTTLIPFIPFIGSVFSFITPELPKLGMVYLIVFTYLVCNELAKTLLRRFQKSD